MKSSFKTIGMMLMAAFVGFSMTACSEKEDPEGEQEKPKVYKTELKSIKIVNAGANGDKVVEGKIDSVTSTITFDERLSAKTNFAAIKFEIKASEGAKLEKDTYDFSMTEEETEKEVVLKLVNHDKYKEYLCTIGKVAPLHGADFTKAENHIISDKDFALNFDVDKWNAIDKNYAFLIGDKNLQYISIADVLAGKKTFTPLKLGEISGWRGSCAGQVSHGHFYICNLASSTKSFLKIYHCASADGEPKLIYQSNIGEIKGTGRYGDNMSMDLDENGNGYMYLQKNGEVKEEGDNNIDVLRLTVSGFTTIKDPTILPIPFKGASTFDNINKIDGTDYYIHSGSQVYPRIVDENLKEVLKFNGVIKEEYNSLRIIEFNKERYLLGITAGRSKTSNRTVYVYNITKGNDPVDAIKQFFTEKEHKAIFEQTVSAAGTSNTAKGETSAITNYYVEKDENGKDASLYLLAVAKGNGLMVTKVPAKVNEE